MVRLRSGLLAALAGSVLLTACFPPFDALLPPPFGFGGPMPGEAGDSILVVNETDDDWVLSVSSDFGPAAYAVPAGATGEAFLFGGSPESVQLLDRECGGAGAIDWDPSFIAVAIEAPGTLRGIETAPSEHAVPLIDFWECELGAGLPPTAQDRLEGGTGSILITGEGGDAWVLDVASGEVAPLLDGFSLEGELVVSPDGARIAYTRTSDDGFAAELFVARIDGSEERSVAENGYGPTFSPDGAHLAFVNLDPFAGGGALMVVDIAGGEPRQIASNASAPRWSPDGSMLAFMTTEPGSLFGGDSVEPSELQVIRPDGTGLRTLTQGPPDAPPPAWSPDGTEIAFVGSNGDQPSDGQTRIDVVTVAGDAVQTVAELDGSALSEPTWSPDGTRVAFGTFDLGLFAQTSGIGIVGVDGGEVETLTSGQGELYWGPIWSPDGRWIAAVRSAEAAFATDLVAIDVASGEETILVSGVMWATAWLPDQLLD